MSVQALVQDVSYGLVRAIAEGQRPLARCIQPLSAILLGQTDDALPPRYVVAVDEDIDPRDADSVNWALSFRTQVDRDIRIVPGRIFGMDHSIHPSDEEEQRYPGTHGCSAMLIDATIKWPYPPVSLPRKDFMDSARQIWEEEGLPKLTPKTPWHRYSLGYWRNGLAEEADLALQGEHFKTGEKLADQAVTLL